MTKQKSFKSKVRERAAKTHESYTAARRQLLARATEPAAVDRPVAIRPHSDAALRARTGRVWDEWFVMLDRWSATDHTHTEIARWLVTEHAVDGWWAQAITVGYEQARGMRAPGQRADGTFEASVSKTFAVPVDRLFAAFAFDDERERWLPGSPVRIRTRQEARSLRADWEDGTSRLLVLFTGKGPAKSTVTVVHQRLADSAALELARELWRGRLTELKSLLEQRS
ncbi:hypothetical protein BH20ACT5_BH20ACT5_22390 [soil metagenome]